MKCEVCGNEYEGVFCNNCGWEEMNILDSDYLKIFNERKEIYKKKLNNNEKFVKFIEKLINKQDEYLKTNIYLAKIFINDMLELLRDIDNSYYIDFLLAKFYIEIKENNESGKIFNELKSLDYFMNEKQKTDFKKLENFAKKRGLI